MIRTALPGVLLLCLASCTGASPTGASAQAPDRAPPAVSPPTPAPARGAQANALATESLADFAKRIRVECTPKGRDLDCIGGKPENGDIYDVELRPDCGADGFFGGVANDAGAELRDALPPKDESTPAVLAAGQLVCIQAIGRVGQDPSYFYVASVPVADVPDCRGNQLCVTYGDRQAAGWKQDASGCHISPSGRPTNACPQGWVRREDIEDFSNGM